ncbi:DUF6468 domain-containing protein [Hirschia baltica]|uniref:DUF6468 domain-containing protein n=1 Tax=Hirschia baltica (strain ATCC 49814 / DSM 5838 / IFAM 1418) TaxID=582402 RepID=C6XN65_HIRBI|nr:DUF6468 domain-containing protein [Hirschia baltica]ACT58235.1 conserved hypothetical protein [Hirschia baltica ATCC 49814]
MIISPSIIVDIFLIVLLVIAIAYFWRLDNRLKAIKSGRDSMLEATKELALTINQAQATIGDLKSTSTDIGQKLQLQIDEARALHTRNQEASVTKGDAGLRRRNSF